LAALACDGVAGAAALEFAANKLELAAALEFAANKLELAAA
jgi:hypothetical protein